MFDKRLTTALLLVALAPGAAASTAESDPTPAAAIEKDLQPIRAHLQNMKMKIQGGVSATIPRGTDGAETAWAAGCCSRNLEALAIHVDSALKTAERLRRLFDREGRKEGTEATASMLDNLKVAKVKLLQLSVATDAARAESAFEAVRTATLNMMLFTRELRACCDDLVLPATP